MVGFQWSKCIKMSLFLYIFMLQFRGITAEDSHFIVREGEDVTLPCKSWIHPQDEGETVWLFSDTPSSQTVQLMSTREDDEKDESKADRLSLTKDLSLGIKAVRVKDAGQYTCRHYGESGDTFQSSLVYLSIIIIHGEKGGDTTTLTCSVLRYGRCGHRVEWLSDGAVHDAATSRDCSATVAFRTPRSGQKYEESFRCRVTDGSGMELLLCTFNSHSACENKVSGSTHRWIYVIVAAVGSAVILATVGALVAWRRRKGHRTQTDNTELTPAVTESAPQTSQDTADPDDGVFYTSVTYNKNCESTARVKEDDDDDDDDDAVIYSGVKSSPVMSDDVYATVVNRRQ
ncbi:hypothetical protein JOB18_025879 [Solea senegalensis]|uniref:Ig-like domain-containing protein n=1 Tax=Solea senegalensis TaxID=28829 RepID=A0AAV6RX78_SOLSE|nr:uncharacterized protein LOC122783785 isoform X2 [Solea senegalensis]KAG7508845.1 hypothetical protein JOB18_025879 [Solea senegalensis]